jgi:hypothetical protein
MRATWTRWVWLALVVLAGGCTQILDFGGYFAADGGDSDADLGCEHGDGLTLQNDPSNCGECGNVCPSGVCIGGVCGITCPSGRAICDSDPTTCDTDITTPANCGGCGITCGADQVCDPTTRDPAVCADECPSHLEDCGGTCIDINSHPDHCRGCGIECPAAPPNTVRGCNEAQGCTLHCMDGWDDCNGDLGTAGSDGCETQLSTTSNCGECGNVCSFANGVAACSTGGDCVLAGCLGNWLDCDPAVDGCETDRTTLANCKTCGNECVPLPNAVRSCNVSTTSGCVYTCVEGWEDCNGDLGMPDSDGCESNMESAQTCGSCSNTCDAAQFCGDDGGTLGCINACVVPTPTLCGDSCVNTQTNPNHCNGCSMGCPVPLNASATCTAGSCGFACQSGFRDCNAGVEGCETQLGTLSNCTGCGDACSIANGVAACGSGGCEVGTCNTGWENCDGSVVTGCEANLNSETSCGSCGNVCTSTQRCSKGTCTPLGDLAKPEFTSIWPTPTGWIRYRETPIEATFAAVAPEVTNAVYECRTAPVSLISGAAWANCDVASGTGRFHRPTPNAGTPEGSYRTQMRIRVGTWYSSIISHDFYVHRSLDDVQTCTPAHTDTDIFNAARPYLSTGSAFSTSRDLRNPFIQVEFRNVRVAPGQSWGIAPGANVTVRPRSLRRRFVMSGDNTMLLVQRQYGSSMRRRDWGVHSCANTFRFGNYKNAPYRRRLDCRNFVLDSRGQGVCIVPGQANPVTTAIGYVKLNHGTNWTRKYNTPCSWCTEPWYLAVPP